MSGEVSIRALSREDREQVVGLYVGLGQRSRALRFGIPTPWLPERLVDELADLDGDARGAVGAFVDGALVGEGRWVGMAGDPGCAEVAITVADAHQRRGLGTRLLGRVIDHARERGVERLTFSVSGENRGMAALLARRGIHLRYRAGTGEATLVLADRSEACAAG